MGEETGLRPEPALVKCNSSSKVLMVQKTEGNPQGCPPHPALECVRDRDGFREHIGRTRLEPS